MSYKMKSPSREVDPQQPSNLREILWALHVAVVERVMEAVQDRSCKPIWISLAISLLRLNDIRVSKAQQSVIGVQQRLGSLVEVSKAMATPFGPPTPLSTISKKEPGREDDK